MINGYTNAPVNYTQLLESVHTRLDPTLLALHSREEARYVFGKIKNLLGSNGHGKIKDKDTQLKKILRESFPDKKDEIDKQVPFISEKYENERMPFYYKLIKKLPTEKEINIKFLQYVSDNYHSFKSSVDYMERLVLGRLQEISPELVTEGAPTSLLIFRQFVKQFGCGEVLVKGEGGEITVEKIRGKSHGAKFDKDGNEKVSSSEVYCPAIKELYLKKYKSVENLREEFIPMSPEEFSRSPLCNMDLATVKAYVNGTYNKKKGVEKITEEELSDEKRFAELVEGIGAEVSEYLYAKYKEGFYDGKMRELAGDLTAEDYKAFARDITEEDMESLLNKSFLAKTARSLAEGFFSNQNKTREYLYIFAIAFEMKVVCNESDSRWADMQSCLFYDYYTDNLVNGTPGQHEKHNIDGHGINWHNFVECIYIYYIAKEEYTPAERLYRAMKTVESCAGNKTKRKSLSDLLEEGNTESAMMTARFKASFLDKIPSMDEKALKEEILQNYECKNEEDEVSVAHIEYSNNRRTALYFFDRLYTPDYERIDEKMYKYDFDLCNEEIPDTEYERVKYVIGEKPLLEKDRDPDVLYTTEEFVEAVNNFFDKVNFRENDDIVERKDILVRLSNNVVWRYLTSSLTTETYENKINSFPAFYDFFRESVKFVIGGKEYEGASSILSQCGYQEVTYKNVFDLLLVFRTYKRSKLVSAAKKDKTKNNSAKGDAPVREN